MPKMKTNKTVAKRFRTTGTGKIVHAQRNKRHILTKKTASVSVSSAPWPPCRAPKQRKYVSSVIDH